MPKALKKTVKRAKSVKAVKAKTARRVVKPWTKEDVRLLKTLVKEKTKTSMVARKLKRTYTATRQKASALGVRLGTSRRKAKA